MSPAPSMHEYGAVPYDDVTPYRVPVYEQGNRDSTLRYARVLAVDSIGAMAAALRVARRHGMSSPAADEPRRVVTDAPQTCTVRGCQETRGIQTRGRCAAHFEAENDRLRCVTPGCENVTSGQGKTKLCQPCSNTQRIGNRLGAA